MTQDDAFPLPFLFAAALWNFLRRSAILISRDKPRICGDAVRRRIMESGYIKPPVEIRYRDELEALKANDTGNPPGMTEKR